MSNRILNLPNLRPGHGVPGIGDARNWTSINVDLQTVADALPVDAQVAFIDEDEPIRAIPDPWAQATAFGQALLKASQRKGAGKLTGLTRRALAQWRGLLAVLALQNQHAEFSLRPQRVDLGDNSLLADVLTTLTPEIAIDGTAPSWGAPTLIMLRLTGDAAGLFEHPLAMTNPICLVSPGRSSHKLVVPNIQWAQGNLGDPLATGAAKLSAKELSTLYHYVAGLARDMGQRSGTIASDITRLLTSYVSDIQTALNRSADPALAPINQYSGEPLPFRLLWDSYKIDDSVAPLTDRKSEAVIKTKGAQVSTGDAKVPGGKVEGFIVVDPAVAEAYGKDPSDILIWGRTDLASLLKSGAKLEKARAEAAAEGYIVVTADDLLTSRAARLKKRPLIRSHPEGLQDMVLPVRPLTLLLVSDLKSAVSGGTAGDRAMVTLKLRLDDGTNDGRALQLTRHYTHAPVPGIEHLLVEAEDWDIYNCQVWPNFRSSVWNIYLARFLYNAETMPRIMRPIHALSAALLREEIASVGDCANAARALKRINGGQKGLAKGGSIEAPLFRSTERRTGKNSSFHEEIQFSNQAFDAIHYVEALGDARSEAPVGLVLVETKEIGPPPSSSKVAIDFGTTNTVAAIGSMRAPPVTFENRLVLPIRHADEMVHEISVHGMRLQFTDFLPPEERGTPIPTVAIPKLPISSHETLWAFRNLIFFYSAQPPAQGAEEAELNDFLESTKDARFNLKWSLVSEEREAAKDFLTQFMVMTAAEMLASGHDPAKSTWYFSVPEAFSASARTDFHDAIVRSSRAIGQSEESTRFPPLLSEGLAAGRYMLSSGQFVADKLNVILDIGGGTTDITIWNGSQPIWRGSLKLAGSNYFTSLLVQNTYILEIIGLSGWARSLDAFAKQPDPGTAEERRKHMAEMLFSGRSSDGERPDLQRAMIDFWDRIGSADGEPLRFAALTYLGGIAWYVGKVVRQLMIHGQLGAYESEDQIAEVHRLVSDPAFAVCGRGGGIFKMMHGARRAANAETAVTKALAVFGRSLGIDSCERPRFSSSDAPKLEVVRGMLDLRDTHAESELQAEAIGGLSNFMPAGLTIRHGGVQIDADTQLKGENLPSKVQSVDMAQFEEFLEALEACTGVAIDIQPESSESAHRRIAAEVTDRMKKMRDEFDKAPRNQRDRVGIEPPFVIALRKLVDMMALPGDDRENLLKVWGAPQ